MSEYSSYSDTTLVILLTKGDRKAFETIYKRYSRHLYNYAYSRVGVKEDCEEMLQDIFVWLWSKHENLHHVTELRPYLYSMIKNRILKYIRHNAVTQEYVNHYTWFEIRYDNSNEQLNALSEVKSLIESSIAALPERCQLAFRLSRFENMPIKKIAEQMNISTGTVENYIVQALKHLRASCADYYKAS